MATPINMEAYTEKELAQIFNPVLQRLRTLLNKHPFWPQDALGKEQLRRAVVGLMTIANKVPPTCQTLFAGYSVRAAFNEVRKRPEWRQPGAVIDPSFLANVKPDKPKDLDPFDDARAALFIEGCLEFITNWRLPPPQPRASDKPPSPAPPANPLANQVAKQPGTTVGSGTGEDTASALDTEKAVQSKGDLDVVKSNVKGKGKKDDEEADLDDDDHDNEGGDGGDADEDEEDEDEDEEGELEGEEDKQTLRRSPRKRGRGKNYDAANLAPECTSPENGSCPRCTKTKKKCERVLQGNEALALASALKRGRKRKDFTPPSNPAVTSEPPVKKTGKRKSAAYIEDSDIGETPIGHEHAPAAKRTRVDPKNDSNAVPKTQVKSKPAGKKPAKQSSKAASPTNSVQVIPMTMVPSTATASAAPAGPSTGTSFFAGTKELGPIFDPRHARPMILHPPPPIPIPDNSNVVPSYPTELPTGNLVQDLVNCMTNQDELGGRVTEAEGNIRGLTASLNRLEEKARIPMVPKADFDELRRKVSVLERDFNQREETLRKTVESALALASNLEERMKLYDGRLDGIEERLGEASGKAKSAGKDAVDSYRIARDVEKTVEKYRVDRDDLRVAQDHLDDLEGRTGGIEQEIGNLRQRCYDLERDTSRLNTSVNQQTLEALLARLGHIPPPQRRHPSHRDGAVSPIPRPIVHRSTSPIPAPIVAPRPMQDRALSPIPAPIVAPRPMQDRASSPIPAPMAIPRLMQDRALSPIPDPCDERTERSTATNSDPPLFAPNFTGPASNFQAAAPFPATFTAVQESASFVSGSGGLFEPLPPDSPLSPPPDSPQPQMATRGKKVGRRDADPPAGRRSERLKKTL
ncbi:hypothetical protein CC1G_13127 [Coprinopsis cinerea okayama7|uniref:Uncharacterized protein n=1 Tax=Coprinopsis cinerea (strain Okayama-7 / 130 / ATCC MYA-4618 / FGSC 9003) TaxID=240176 RepID=A8P079_COPC7|nr:hypothetical protein CC1G_13127 [Coprinopsis cinerea okayama7\|eukprot:XP_001837832.2 hypothetical protein CC1G_13127 [Coprinopsis cinerea okayama7\